LDRNVSNHKLILRNSVMCEKEISEMFKFQELRKFYDDCKLWLTGIIEIRNKRTLGYNITIEDRFQEEHISTLKPFQIEFINIILDSVEKKIRNFGLSKEEIDLSPGNNVGIDLTPRNNDRMDLSPGNNDSIDLTPRNNDRMDLSPGNRENSLNLLVCGEKQELEKV